MTTNELANQLVDIYFRKDENYHKELLPRDEAIRYHEKLISQGSIITASEGTTLLGFVEVWRITFEQFGRIICGEPFSAFNENILNGYIAYVGDTYIRPEYRDGRVAKRLRNRFFEMNEDCTYFAGNARRKRGGLIKVFKRSEIKLSKEIIHVG